jgi:catechol 2,3-dioxygenase-like lactoylglutathione lyase family enzyme
VIDKRELPFQANNAFFYYADVDRATDFYREVMGFQLVADYGFARMFQIATSSFLTLVDATKGMHTADEPKTVTLALVTDDVAGWYEYAQAQGIPIHRDYTPDALKGHEGFVMLDPEGYFLEVERFNPHPENERLLPRIESLVPHYPEDQRATRRPMGLGITATVLWLYYRDLEAGLRFFAENLCLTRVADQAFSHIFASSRSGFLGAVQAGRGLHPYTEQKAATVSLWTEQSIEQLHARLKEQSVPLRHDEVQVRDRYKAFVAYDPEGYFFEFNTFLDVPENQELTRALRMIP